MTSLSHDVKTPLTSLVGYLKAIREKIVTGEEKEEYIGVAFVRELVAVHGGTICAENSPQSGTIFSIMLPKAL